MRAHASPPCEGDGTARHEPRLTRDARSQQLLQVDDDDVGAVLAQRVGTDAAVDARRPGRSRRRRRPATPDTRPRARRTAAWARRAARRRPRSVSGAGLPARCSFGGHLAVDDDREVVDHAGGLEDGAGRCASWTRWRASRRARQGLDAARIEPGRPRRPRCAASPRSTSFLRLPSAADGLGGGIVGRVAVGQLDAPRLQERAHAVVARLAVDVREVVGVGVGLGAPRCPARKSLNICVPGAHVHLGRRRDHAVEVEQGGVVVVPVHPFSVGAARPRHRTP